LSFYTNVDEAVHFLRPLVKNLAIKEDLKPDRRIFLVEFPELKESGLGTCTITLMKEPLLKQKNSAGR